MRALQRIHLPLSDEQLDDLIDRVENLLEQGHPTWTYGIDGENEYSDEEIASLLPSNPVNPFASAGGKSWSHEDQDNDRVLSLKPFDSA